MASRQPSDPREVPPGSILLVVHDFIARSPDELSLAKGDRIELIERDDDFGDGWFLGRHMTNSATGLFPEGEKMSLIFDSTETLPLTPTRLPQSTPRLPHEALS